jgi:hypothetical protein
VHQTTTINNQTGQIKKRARINVQKTSSAYQLRLDKNHNQKKHLNKTNHEDDENNHHYHKQQQALNL